ncbi:MAG: ADP-ribosylglycohydrolase family protein [Candidatus Freyarchaeota archaeon]
MVGLEEFKRLLSEEITQRKEEGYDVTEIEKRFRSRVEEANFEELCNLLAALEKCKLRAGFPYVEPSDLPTIRGERPQGPRSIDLELSDKELLNKVLGGWLGRCAGCLLGKPAEFLNKEQIKEWLTIASAYPLKNYFPPIPNPPNNAPVWLKYRLMNSGVLLGQIKGMPRDDDIDYTILNLHVLESSGFNLSTMDVGKTWLSVLPYNMVYTAESVAYRNLVNGLLPPETALHLNPYREWIGAQIRADTWGYVTPGMPELAAELAHKDASLSHTKNGIYGEMFVSAMISAAFTTNDVEKIVKIGLSEIPKRSRLAEAVKDTVKWSKKYDDWKNVWDSINEKYGSYSPVHTINNAALIIMGLLCGEGDFEKSITTSVMGGFDTDCNGATTGSILGVILGAKNLPKKWIKPLNNRIESYIVGYNNSQISELAKRTFRLAKKSMQTRSTT